MGQFLGGRKQAKEQEAPKWDPVQVKSMKTERVKEGNVGYKDSKCK